MIDWISLNRFRIVVIAAAALCAGCNSSTEPSNQDAPASPSQTSKDPSPAKVTFHLAGMNEKLKIY